MNIVPQNKNVVCRCISSSEKKMESGFVYKTNDIPEYEVVSISDGAKVDISIKPGDIVVTNATGTKAVVDGVEYVMFSSENIAGKEI